LANSFCHHALKKCLPSFGAQPVRSPSGFIHIHCYLSASRVIILGEFSPVGRLFTLVIPLNYRSSQKFGGYIFRGISYVIILSKKLGWATFWVFFSTNSSISFQLHL
jgi:hypothetical protein